MEIEIAPLGIAFILLHISAKITNFIFFLLGFGKIQQLRKAPNLSNLLSVSDRRTRKEEMEPELKIFQLSNRHDICQKIYATAVLEARILRKKRVNCDDSQFATKERKSHILRKSNTQIYTICVSTHFA